MLTDYSWPGNVRELQNVILRAMVLAHQAPIDTQHLIFDDIPAMDEQSMAYKVAPFFVGQDNSALDQSMPSHQSYLSEHSGAFTAAATTGLNQAVKNSECQTIMAALRASRSRDQAAEKLGISPRTLRHKLQKLREQGVSVTRAYAR
jgi:two-component system response regulator FlrC